MLTCDLVNRRVVHTSGQKDVRSCDDPGGFDGHIKKPRSSTRIFLHWIDWEVDRFGHFGAKWSPTLHLTPHVPSQNLQFEASSTQDYQMLNCDLVDRRVARRLYKMLACDMVNRRVVDTHVPNVEL